MCRQLLPAEDLDRACGDDPRKMCGRHHRIGLCRLDGGVVSEPDRPIVAGDVYQSRVRKKRQGEGLHHVEQLFEGNDRRQLLGEAGQELERVIRSLQRVGALFHAFFQLGLRLQQALLVAAERPLRNDSLGDVECVPEHVKRPVW